MSETYEEAIRDAIETVERAGLDPDSRAGSVAFQYALGVSRAPERADPASERPADEVSDGDSQQDDPAGRVAKWADVPRKHIEDNFEFGADGALVRVSSQRLPKEKSGKQVVVGILKLAIDREGYHLEEVSTKAVNLAVAEYKAVDQNIFKHLVGRGDLVSRRGQRGNYSYRLTQQGIEKAAALVRAIAAGDQELAA